MVVGSIVHDSIGNIYAAKKIPGIVLAFKGMKAIPTTYYQNQNNPMIVSGWWFQPIWKILVKLEIFPK